VTHDRPLVLVTGATGLVGSELVRRLSDRGVRVRALVRNSTTANLAKAADLSRLPGVEIADGDLARPDSLIPALRGVDRAMLISSSDAAMREVQFNFIDAAASAGLGHVVKLSGIIPELDSPFRFARMHGEIELHLEQSGVPFTHIRAGEFMHSYFRQVPSILKSGALRLPMANARIASIDIDDIAVVAADVLTGPGHEGRIYPITGPESLGMAEVAARLSDATGLNIRYEDVSAEDFIAARLAAGAPAYAAEGLGELFAERRKGKEAMVYTTVETVFGRKPTSFADFATRYAAVFRGESPAPRVYSRNSPGLRIRADWVCPIASGGVTLPPDHHARTRYAQNNSCRPATEETACCGSSRPPRSRSRSSASSISQLSSTDPS
jgi:uncharacterized protein YbjT (DUF2867 family)